MAWAVRACHCRPASSLALLALDPLAFSSDPVQDGDDVAAGIGGFFFDGRIQSNSANWGGTSLFVMDAQTGAYTFGYDTGTTQVLIQQ